MKEKKLDAENSELESEDELKNLEQFVKRREKQKQVLKKLLEQNDAKRTNNN